MHMTFVAKKTCVPIVSLTSHSWVAVHQDVGLPAKLNVDEQRQGGKYKRKGEKYKNLCVCVCVCV